MHGQQNIKKYHLTYDYTRPYSFLILCVTFHDAYLADQILKKLPTAEK